MAAEETKSGLTAFDSDGFTVGSWVGTNKSGDSHVAWNWKANGTGVTNNNGTITSTVSANQDAGFSIVSYTGTQATDTVGHGLSSAPEMVIQKGRSYADNWHVGSTGLSYTSGEFLRLNSNAVKATNTNIWGSTAPTTTVFTLGADGGVNGSGSTNIAYCFHSVDGYSKVGSYTGNGSSSDGTFVYTGFRPAYVMIKSSSFTDIWGIYDNERSTYNVVDDFLRADSNHVEQTNDTNVKLDFLSNGFKARGNNDAVNKSGGTLIYIAFAEHPFKYTNAR